MRLWSTLVLATFRLIVVPLPAQSFDNFESPQSHPIAVSADGNWLYAVNTPDNRLAVFSLRDPSAPVLLKEISVGLEPVAVRPRTPDELWVVNHLSDSLSVVSVSHGVVIDTIRANDEPADVAFASGRAFVSLATDREVRVFDAVARVLVGTVPIFGDEPRALIASADGQCVYVAVQRSGNKTTIVPASLAPAQPPPTNPFLPPPPRAGLIVSSEDPQWKPAINVHLPDHDIVEIDAISLEIRRNYTGMGTTLFNLTQRPGANELWVANTEARNRDGGVNRIRSTAGRRRERSAVESIALHPMKGPMTTQTLKGLAGTEPFHWRGDRATLQEFNSAFVTLLGRKSPLPAEDMDDFAAFLKSILYPPNPRQNLDRSFPTTPAGASPQEGFAFYTNTPFRSRLMCDNCHSVEHHGTDGRVFAGEILDEPQAIKTPQLRNIYKRLGRQREAQGRTAGFGLLHDGSVDDVFELLSKPVFGRLAQHASHKTMLQNYVLAFDTGSAPIVGYSRTFSPSNVASQEIRSDAALLAKRAAAGDCDVVIIGLLDGRHVGMMYDLGSRKLRTDRAADATWTPAELGDRIAASQGWLTMIGVPLGSGMRIGIDRDEDGVLNGDEPSDP